MNSTINSIPDEQSKCTCNRPLSSYDNLDTNALMLVSASSSSSPPQNHSYNSNSNANYKNITNINNSNHHDNQNILMMNIMNGINEPEKNSLNLMPPRLQTTSSSSSSSISSQLSSSLAQNRNVNNNYNTQNIANSDNLRFKVNSFNNSMTPSSPRSIAAAAATTTTTGTSVSIGAALTPTTATTAIAAAAGLPVLMTTAATTQKLPVAISNNINNNNDSDESKNIVFVSRHTINKPVISDAKSKFFGYNQNQNYINNSNSSGCSSNSPKNSTVESGNNKTITKLTTTTTSAAESMIEKPTAQLLTTKTLKTTSPSASSIATVGATAAFNNKSNIDCDGNTRLLENNNNNSCNKPRISLISSNCNSNTIITENLRIINCSDNSNSYCSTVCIDNEKYSKNFDQPVYQYHLHYQEHQQQQQQQHQQHQELRNFSSSIHNNNNNNSNCNSKAGNLKSTTTSMHETEINQPSQLVYMSTTVPQNIKGNDIAGRHTPTRNSLRHSRMLVVNKSFQGPKSQNPLGLRYPYLTKILLYLHIVFGTLLALIGFWILLWAPNTRLQDNPYWSGITLTLAGILGLIVVGFKRMRRHKLRENCFVFLKYDSYMLTLVASVLCFIALICASIHLNNITASTTKCISTNILIDNAACTCMFGLTIDTPIQSLSSPDVRKNLTQNPINGVQSQEFYYRDLSCSEVDGAWKFILTVSVLLNALGFCVTIFYIVSVFWKRSTKNFYTSVRTNAF